MGYIENLRKLVGHQPVILVGSVAILVDELGRLLLQQRMFPKGAWGIPGGLMELAESTEDVAKRELLEETGLTIDHLQLINVYSGSQSYIKAENGDEFYAVTIAYYTKHFSGDMQIDHSESMQFQFFAPEELPEGIVKSHQVIIQEFLEKHYK